MDERTLPAELLNDLTWLQGLARRLVQDSHLADDAVQETVLAALAERPRRVLSPRAWLATVLRNAVRKQERGRARREVREAAVEVPTTAPATLEVVEELALHRRLVDCVQALDEPYRSAIVRRYLHDRRPREIAREDGVPVKTVHTRIDRGLTRLRERLDREWGGERESWVLALLPLAQPRAAEVGIALGALWIPMNVKVFAAIAAVVALGSLFPFVLDSQPAATQAGAAAPAPSPVPVLAPAALRAGTSEPGRAAIDAPAPAEPEATAAPEQALARLEGFTRELDGRPVRGLRVVLEDGGDVATTTSAADGSFALELVDPVGRFTVRSDEYTAIARPHTSDVPDSEPFVVVVAPSCAYAGRVIDETGAPIEGVEVDVGFEGSFLKAFEAGGHGAHLFNPLASTRTDEFGEFAFEPAVFVEGVQLFASRDGYESASLALPPHATFDLELTLAKRALEGRTIFGLVANPTGAPVGDAQVSLGWSSVHTDERGRFALELLPHERRGTLFAIKAGFGPGALAFDWEEGRGRSAGDPVRVLLGAAPLAIEGRLVDASGTPVAGARVWSPDTTYFGQAVQRDGERAHSGVAAVEALVMDRPAIGLGSQSIETTTGADGRFRLEGLCGRAYTILALDPSSLARTEPVFVPAGAKIELRLEEEELRPVAGRVVSRKGTPLANVTVAPGRGWSAALPFQRSVDSWSRSPMTPPSLAKTVPESSIETDEEGRFRFPTLAARDTFLSLSGKSILLTASHRLAESTDLEQIQIVVDALCRVRVVADDPDAVSSFARIDAEGEVLPLFVRVETVTVSTPSVDVIGGRSGIALLEEGEHTLVFYRGREEVGRRDVVLGPGAVIEIRP